MHRCRRSSGAIPWRSSPEEVEGKAGMNGESMHVYETGGEGAVDGAGGCLREGVLLEEDQLTLMVRIHELGSIGLAARSLGIGFKEAWDRVMAINRLSAEPLIYRVGIGTTSGVTLLSEEGRMIVSRQGAKAG